ncbi:MAG: nuclear transport factor 2 family protein [Pirellulales bacterium]
MSGEANLQIVRRYLRAVEQFATGDELAVWFAPDVVQQEFPNRIFAQGMSRGLAEILAGAERGKQLLSSQRYDVQSALAEGDRVALEIVWTGVLAMPAAGLEAGAEMRAHLGVFIELENGKIKRQRNYDCYQPW